MAGTPAFEVISQHQCFGGSVGFYRHESGSTGCPMRFSVFTPPQARTGRVPVLYYLAGLTCTEETFMIKGGAQRIAAQLGLALVAPDTSPRGLNLPGESESWDFGVAAGFYLDATQQPWARNYRMYTYVTQELRTLIEAHFPVEAARTGIFGHSMGGHGALTLGLRNPQIYKSLSAFAPIAAPKQVPWGQKAFNGYLGPDTGQWSAHDATELMAGLKDVAARPPILVDQGMADQFLEKQLHPHLLEAAAKKVGYPLTLRRQEGYDHGYYFISTFMEDHLRHHARTLGVRG
ncbi:MAG TPA: S-formylglutathione hydrolase [Steroidobacteraceae bacterium]|nr:S-formylglutathione hydrolase [Steroidobacteraceae bacterium]